MNLAYLRVTGAAATVALLAGCATGAAHQSGPSTPTPSPTLRSRTNASPAAPLAVSSSASQGPLASCASAPFHASTATVEGAAGSRYLTIRLTNDGSSSCHLLGYPGVSIVARDRRTQVGAAADRDASVRPVPVVLPPGGHTTFVLRVTQALNYPAATCKPRSAYGYRIYPPDSRTAILLRDPNLTGCATTSVHLMTVRPVGAAVG